MKDFLLRHYFSYWLYAYSRKCDYIQYHAINGVPEFIDIEAQPALHKFCEALALEVPGGLTILGPVVHKKWTEGALLTDGKHYWILEAAT